MRKFMRGALVNGGSRASTWAVNGVAASAVLVTLATLPMSGFAQNALGSRVLIGTSMVTATGCHDTTRTFVTSIPNADQLDRSYNRGVLAGIEMVETAANNGHAVRNVAFTNNGTAITYELYAKGAGYWVPPPKLFGVTAGGGYCDKAAGGSQGAAFYAHYKQ